jgi:hypothetical protein
MRCISTSTWSRAATAALSASKHDLESFESLPGKISAAIPPHA